MLCLHALVSRHAAGPGEETLPEPPPLLVSPGIWWALLCLRTCPPDRNTAAFTGKVWSLSEQTVLRAHGVRVLKESFQLPGKAKLDLESP